VSARGWRTSAGRRRATVFALALALVAPGACEVLLTDPAPAPELAVAFAPVAAGLDAPSVGGAAPDPGTAHAFGRIDRVRLRLVRPDSVARDTIVRVSVVDGTVRARLVLLSKERVPALGIFAELRAGDQPLFTGGTIKQIRLGEPISVRLEMSPVPVALLVPAAGVTLTALGDSVRLPAAAVFATGDTILGAHVSWTSANPAVIEARGAFGLARGPGEAQLTARLATLTARLTARVVQAPDTVDVQPASATIRRSESRTLSATVLDRNRRPIAGAVVTWTSSAPAIAAVSAAGVVTGVTVGQAGILARAGNARGGAQIRVDP
jgi:Big-like domain-containing protein